MRNGPIIQLPFRTTLPGDARQTKYDVMLTHPETNVVDDLNDSRCIDATTQTIDSILSNNILDLHL